MQDTGVTVVLGEVDVAQVNQYRSGKGEPSVHMAWSAPHRPAAVTQLQEGGGRHEVSHLPGGRRPPGPDYVGLWGMRDDTWREQKEGSVEHLDSSVATA